MTSFKSIIDSPDYTIDNLIKHAVFERAGDDLFAIHIAGKSDQLASGVKEEIWDAGGIRTVMQVAATFSVVSASAGDASAGTGARTVLLVGLDSDWKPQTEIVTTNGLTPVVTTKTFRRIWRAVVGSSGATNTNDGNITITETDGSSTQALIPAGNGITQMSHFTVPDEYNAMILKTNRNIFPGGTGGTRSGVIMRKARVYTDDTSFTEVLTDHIGLQDNGTGVVAEEYRFNNVVPERTDIIFEVEAAKNDTFATVTYSVMLIKERFRTYEICFI